MISIIQTKNFAKITEMTKEKNNNKKTRNIKKSKAKNIIKATLLAGIIFLINIVIAINSVKATQLNAANIFSEGECGSLLIYKGIVVKAYYAQYIENGVSYPAYCLDKTKAGVNTGFSYSVTIDNAITDVGLWRVVTNGYPYKTLQELGCNTKEEAFTATKQAVYCYIHGNNPDDYRPIGEAGQRTLNALKQIVTNAKNSTETQISNNVNILAETDKFEIDDKNKEYVSKVYSIKAQGKIKNYKIVLEKINTELLENIKVTDLQSNEKVEFQSTEKFKIMIPIKDLKQETKFKIKATTEIKSKPVLYGKAPNSTNQDYALAAATYEDAKGEKIDSCYKNETELKIIKQDEKTKERLEGVEFQILDSNKKIIYTNLKTDNKGEIYISNLIPGTYYLKETNTKDGYIIQENLIEFTVKLNQKLTITVNNSLEEKPEINIEEKEMEATVIKKLPKTGM